MKRWLRWALSSTITVICLLLFVAYLIGWMMAMEIGYEQITMHGGGQ